MKDWLPGNLNKNIQQPGNHPKLIILTIQDSKAPLINSISVSKKTNNEEFFFLVSNL